MDVNGFFGGILGGILVTMISYIFQKWYDQKEQIKSYKEEIKEILDEICNTWDDYRASIYDDSDQIVLMKGLIHELSRKLTKKTSRQHSLHLTTDILGELRELSQLLTDIMPSIDENHINSGYIDQSFDEICGKAKKIKNNLD